jgi:CRP-like cAMP-binding protein
MISAFITKLASFVDLGDDEISILEHLSSNPEERRRGEVLVEQGQRSDRVNLIVTGWAYRYKVLNDGRRQILGYLLPGDLCDLHASLLREMDHSIGLLTDAQIVTIPSEVLNSVIRRHSSLARAFWRAALVEEAILREWLTNVGQRDAVSRIAHHLCELWFRMMSVGLVSADDEFDLPLTQEEIGDALGLTTVHVNRTIQRLRLQGLIKLKQKRLTVLDPQRLLQATDFDATYLLSGRP